MKPAYQIFYDAECPLCRVYTQGFVKAGILADAGRIPWSKEAINQYGFDSNRSKEEIVIVNADTLETHYGLDSLLTLIGTKANFIERFFRTKPLFQFLEGLYEFISFNRKIIYPAQNECRPRPHYIYNVIYILIASIFTALVLHQFSFRLPGIVPPSHLFREWIICLGQIGFQFIFLTLLGSDKKLEYLGNVMTVSLIGALMLIPTLYFIAPLWFNTAWFGGVVTFMFFEHFRRVKILNQHPFLCVSWMLYRILIVVLYIIIL